MTSLWTVTTTVTAPSPAAALAVAERRLTGRRPGWMVLLDPVPLGPGRWSVTAEFRIEEVG